MKTRTNLTPEVTGTLRDLIEINADSYKGFNKAAEAVDDETLAELFRSIGSKRKEHCDELRGQLNGRANEKGSTAGKLHRWWIEARSAMQSGDSVAILSEAERGEDEIKSRYEKAMKSLQGSPVIEIVNRHYTEVKRNHDRIRDLRDRRKREKSASS